MSSRKEYIGKLTRKVNTLIVCLFLFQLLSLSHLCPHIGLCSCTVLRQKEQAATTWCNERECSTSLPAPSGRKSLNALISLMPVILPCNAIFVSYIFDLYESVRCEYPHKEKYLKQCFSIPPTLF